MIYTSYFGKVRKLPKDIEIIAICGKSPAYYHGLEYKKLAPKYDFFKIWKETHDNEYYIRCFHEQVLKDKDPYTTVKELISLLPETKQEEIKKENVPIWESKTNHIALLCYERPEDFCHRHLVADWVIQSGIKVEEYKETH